jgi:hypothetical protein
LIEPPDEAPLPALDVFDRRMCGFVEPRLAIRVPGAYISTRKSERQ